MNGSPAIFSQQGRLALQEGRHVEAERCFRAALILTPADPELLVGLAISLRRQEKVEESKACCLDALRLAPDLPEAHFNLGVAFHVQNHWHVALEHYRSALKLRPDYIDVLINAGWVFHASGDLDNALACYRRLDRLAPANPMLRSNLGQVLLARGEWTAEAWDACEARWELQLNERYSFPVPEWTGQPLEGKKMVLWPEQGQGSNIMMFRYAAWLAARGAAVTVMAEVPLLALFQRHQETISVVPANRVAPLPAGDYHCPMMGLLRVLKITSATIHNPPSYLHARPEPRPASLSADLKHIGLVWAGKPEHGNDLNRSLPHFRVLAPLLEFPNLVWHSLQLGSRENECLGFEVAQPAKAFKDFDDTAAFIQHLDLVITVDTAVAHLAGALGKPVWILLSTPAEWRWYPYGETTPWYPSARLFIQKKKGDWDEVIARVKQALTTAWPSLRVVEIPVSPPSPSFKDCFNAGVTAWNAGQSELARQYWEDALRLEPQAAVALGALASLHLKRQEFPKALDYARRWMESAPGESRPLMMVVDLDVQLERWADAESAAMKLLELQPGLVPVWNLLGIILQNQERLLEAESAYRKALQGQPDNPQFLYNLAILLVRLQRHPEAEPVYRHLLRLNPQDAEVWNNLGTCLFALGREAEGMSAYATACGLAPEDPEILNNIGTGHLDAGEFVEAHAIYARALKLRPGYLEAEFHFGHLLLCEGRWIEGWPFYERRREVHVNLRTEVLCPEWKGAPLAGKRILLLSEQGYGDNIMMFRYAEELASRQAEVAVAVRPPLVSLLQRGHPAVHVLPLTEAKAFSSRCDCHCLMMSLPQVLAITPATVLSPSSYLFARPIQRPEALDRQRFHVGIVWSGNQTNANDRRRSLSHFRVLKPLLEIPGTAWHSLQIGLREDECLGFEVTQPAKAFKDFDDTAAFIQHLDLVITVDTSVAHLAGALGKPVWILLPKPAEWRWYPYGETTPWYPSARLFIQSKRGDWDEVIARVTVALQVQLDTERKRGI
jgi:tetratricopeptide (TPR) repeat protein/ADP-heptose:LPS heptosyltransferase